MPPALTTTWRPARSGPAGAAGQHPAADLVDLGRVGQPALAGVHAGEPADGGLDDDGAAAAQRGHVLPGGGVLPHLGVHGGREDHRAAGGEQGVGEQVVGEAVRGLGEQVGGGRGDHDQVGVLPDPHVRDLVDVVPDLGGDGLPGQRRPGRLADEVQRGLGGHHPDVVAGLGEPAQQLARLVGGDAAAHPQHDLRRACRPWPWSLPSPVVCCSHDTPRARRSRRRARGNENRCAPTGWAAPRRPRRSAGPR